MGEGVKGTLPWNDGSRKPWDPYRDLAATVIKGAVVDFISVLRKQNNTPVGSEEWKRLEDSIRINEKFFYSANYDLFVSFLETEIDPDVLIRECRLRAKEEPRKKKTLNAKKHKNPIKH